MRAGPETAWQADKMKILGIFILTDRHPDYLLPLAMAAGAKGMQTHVHFAGSGVRLIPEFDLDLLPASTRITICSESARSYRVDHRLQASLRQRLVPPGRMSRLVRQCDCHLFF